MQVFYGKLFVAINMSINRKKPDVGVQLGGVPGKA